MQLKALDLDFSVCKINDIKSADLTREFFFLAKTDEEISLVCETGYVPAGAVACESGFRAIRVTGVLDFGMVGVIAGVSKLLKEAGISIFVVSTYNTDYIFVKKDAFARAVGVLSEQGYTFI